jgi:hypothetical protein
MKKPVMLQILMILLFVLGYSIASAQGDYVVTIKGDTLRGKVKYFAGSGVKYANASTKYVQLTPENGKKSTHEILQTIAFRMKDEDYHTIKFEEGYTFMKLIKPGYLSLYSYQLENQTTWDGRYFVKKDATLLDVPNIGFKKRVPRFLADCPDVVKDIESGTLGRTDLLKIVDAYNACMDLKTNATLVKKSPALEAFADLEAEVKALPEFDRKADALEMIREVKNKLVKKESLPSFLVNGLKDALKDQGSVAETLDQALEKLN